MPTRRAAGGCAPRPVTSFTRPRFQNNPPRHRSPTDPAPGPPPPPPASRLRAPQFIEEGKFQKQADMARLQAKFGETEARKIAAREARERRNAEQMEKLEADADPNLIPLGARLGVKGDAAATAASRAAAAARLPPVPDVEWWDAPSSPTGRTTTCETARGTWRRIR